MKSTKSIQAILFVPIFVIVFLSSCCVGMPMMYSPHYNYRPMYMPHHNYGHMGVGHPYYGRGGMGVGMRGGIRGGMRGGHPR